MIKENWRILHIDDDEEDHIIVQSLLSKAEDRSVILDWADTLADGRQKLNTNHYHAILIDYDMGENTGIELVRELSGQGFTAPMILLTGRGSKEVDIEAMNAGATLYLTKDEINSLLLERMIRYAIERKNAEVQLRLSEEKFSIIFYRSPTPTFLLSMPEMRFVNVNQAFLDQFGFGKDEVIGKTNLELGIIYSKEFRIRSLESLKSSGYARELDVESYIKQGDRRILSINLELIAMEGAEYILGTAEDVTERKQVEEQLRVNEAAMEAFFKASPVILNLFDQDLHYIKSDPLTPTYFGLDRTSIIGKTVWDLNPSYAEQFLGPMLQRVSQSGKPELNIEFSGPVPNRQGELGHFQASFFPVPLPDDRLGMGVIAGDITDQFTLQNENQQHKDLLERMLKTIPIGIAFLKGPHHVYYLVNDEYRRYARGKGDLIGYSVAEKWPEIAEIIIPQMDRVFQTGKPFSITDAHLRIIHGGEPEDEYFSYTFTPIYQADGNIEGVMILAVNTTAAVLDRMAVEAQSDRLEAVLDSLPVGVWITDQHGRIIRKNEQADRIWAGEAPLSEHIESYQQYTAWTTDREKVLLPEEYPVARALKTGEPVEPIELKIRRFDNTEGTVLVSAAPIIDREGVMTGVVGLNLDISERKQVEEALAKSESEFRHLADTMPQLVWTAQPDGTVDYYNSRYLVYGGIAPEEKDCWEWGPVLHQDDLEPTLNAWQEALRTGGVYQIEHRARMADGSYRWHLSRGVPTLDEQGKIVKWFGTATDIHDFKQVQEELILREERISHLFDSNLVGIISREIEGNILEANDAFLKITGYTREDIESGMLNIKDIIPPEYHSLDIDCYQELISNRRCKPYEKEYIRKDGARAPVLIGYSLFKEKPPTLIGFVLDLSELKKAQNALAEYAEKLKKSNEELENFAYIASHDLQEPLRKISMFGRTLRKQLSGQLDEQTDDYLERMESAANRMQSMINGLLDLSKVTTREETFKTVDLNQVATEVISDLETRVHSTGGEVIVEELPKVTGDYLQLRQLLQNLVVNGLKFHRDDVPPVVRISGEEMQIDHCPHVKICVEDNGIGFSENNTELIFHPFVRLHGRSKYEGSGIGLAICCKIVERHGGIITASSRLGEGSLFTIILPRKG